MKISIYAGNSKDWWTYLAIRSNPPLVASIEQCPRGAVFFDELWRLPERARALEDFFYIFWDGLAGDTLLQEARCFLGPGKRLTALVVGDYSAMADAEYRVQSLYGEGALHFSKSRLHFDLKTAGKLFLARAKTWLMPLKNLAQSKSNLGPLTNLLVGRSRVVFCGSYGTIPVVMEHLCKRRGLNPAIFDEYEYYSRDPDQTFANFRRYLDSNGRFLAKLYGSKEVDETFFASALHLLGREYFVERIRAEGIDTYANGYATGLNVNVYTTPFYRQHVFVDFGSVAGAGNYPRLADLVYFGKKTERVSLGGNVGDLAACARRGLLNDWFDGLWDFHAPALRKAVEAAASRSK